VCFDFVRAGGWRGVGGALKIKEIDVFWRGCGGFWFFGVFLAFLSVFWPFFHEFFDLFFNFFLTFSR